MRIIEIVDEQLRTGGFDGLISDGGECGCELDDLAPCGNDFSQCEPGYKHIDPRGGNPPAWAIWKQKEKPSDEQWENM